MVDQFVSVGNAVSADVRGGFDVAETWIGRIVVLAACGDLDLLSAPHLTKAIHHVLAQSPDALVVDLSELEFLASAGMSVLIAAHEAAAAESTLFAVVADGPATSRPMKTLGIDMYLRLRPTLDNALRDIQGA